MSEVMKERERCARLNEALAEKFEASAARVRVAGSFNTRSLWPPFRKITVIAEKWDRTARDIEAAARSLRTVAHCIREGYDPDKA